MSPKAFKTQFALNIITIWITI